MKHLLTGVAIAAALAISAPAWAQNVPGPKASGGGSQTATPMKPAAPPAAAPAAAAKPMAAKGHAMRRHHPMRHHAMSSDDAATEQLNQQELARIQGGGGAPVPAPGGPGPGTQPGPRPSPQH